MDCGPPGSSMHGISQARILEWVTIFSSRGSSQPQGRTASRASAGGFFITEPPGKPLGNTTVTVVFSRAGGDIKLRPAGKRQPFLACLS